MIGEGLLGTVRSAMLKSDGKHCVLKCMSKDEVRKYHDERHVINERRILSKMNHPFIVEYFGAFQVFSSPSTSYLCVLICVPFHTHVPLG